MEWRAGVIPERDGGRGEERRFSVLEAGTFNRLM